MSSLDHGNENDSAATPADQVAFDDSVGSDTDTGAPTKNDTLINDGHSFQHHARSNSVKKPTSFKAVSVTKNFLAKAGTPPTPNPKINGENIPTNINGAGAMAGGPRPRLVAKSSGSKPGKAHFGTRNGAGPDPMQVWNRNRAAPQHPPKHLTDEELKQQYGIHLATRIQADGDGKEAKWADIDDDEDDWAPETIEWNDGTKIDLSQKDTAALLAEQRALEEAAKKREEEDRKAKAAKAAADKKPITSVGPNATVLKPRSLQPKPGTPLVLKTPTEKPTLVSKPASTTPAKSPWAPLPAVDKVPPIEINPPVQSIVSRLQPNGVQPTSTSEAPLQPALEIPADSFRRGGAEAQRDTVGQLYNDKSGKYEPAATGSNGPRRGSSAKKDGNFRAPSVLQRGGPSPDASAILEKTASGTEPADTEARQQSFADRRESQHSLQSPAISSAQLSSAESPSQDSRVPGAYRAGHGPNAGHSASERDDVALQRQMMKEKRDQAIKRRKEQEEREEAEKKERIRKKLESLGMEPAVGKKEEKKETPAVTIEKRPADSTTAGREKAAEEEEAVPETKTPAASPAKFPKSPPKPPVPSASGEPLQYGMMKLHAPGPRDPLQQVNDTLTAERAKLQPSVNKISRHTFETQPPAARGDMRPSSEQAAPSSVEQREHLHKVAAQQAQGQQVSPPGFETRPHEDFDRQSPMLNGTLTPNKMEPLFSRSPELTSQRLPGELRQQPWNEGLKDPKQYPGWSTQHLLREPNNVWGAPNQSRPLGNGTFDPTIQRPTSRHQQDQYHSPALAPIGPPKHLQQSKDAGDGRSPYGGALTNAENLQTVPTYPSSDQLQPERREANDRLVNGVQKQPVSQTAPTQQFNPSLINDASQLRARDSKAALAAWNDFGGSIAQKEAEERRQWMLQREARRAEEARSGLSHHRQMNFEETWKQIEVPDKGFDRKVVGVHRQMNVLNAPGVANQPAEIRGPSFVNPTDLSNTMAPGFAKGSRFFPTSGRVYHASHMGQAPFSPYHRRSDSPPPPDMELHPAYALDNNRIRVRLPSGLGEVEHEDEVGKKPKVRLPPSTITPSQSPQPAPAQLLPLRQASQPLVNNPSWQERFNNMLGTRKSFSDRSPEKKTSQTVEFSATKEPLALPSPEIQAAVALPPSQGIQSLVEVDVASLAFADEEALFEPEAGSMPAVCFPATLGHRPWQDKPLKRGQLKPLTPSKEVEAATSQSLALPETFDQQNMLLVVISLAGWLNPQSKPMKPPMGYQPPPKESRPQHPGPSNTNHTQKGRQVGRGFKNRESSGNQSNHPKTAHSNSQRNPGQRNNYRNSNNDRRTSGNPNQGRSWDTAVAT